MVIKWRCSTGFEKDGLFLTKSKNDDPRGTFDVFGERALSVCGPRLWNALPTQLRLEVDFDAFNDILFGILT